MNVQVKYWIFLIFLIRYLNVELPYCDCLIILDCGYYCHIFCVEKIKRVCTAVVASEHSMILTITPSNGLLSQDYKCAECQSYIRIRNPKISSGNIKTIS